MKKKHEAEQFELGLLPKEEITNPGAGEKWDRRERDKALNEYCEGAHPKRLGVKYKGAPKSFVNSILNKLKYNDKKKGKEDQPGRAERYRPTSARMSRKGRKNLSPNERDIIRCHEEIGLDPEVTARILMRDVHEIAPDIEGRVQVAENKRLAVTLDLVLAYRYIYHVYDEKLISNKTYDDMKAEEIEYGGGAKALAGGPRDCPSYIKTLAVYLSEKVKREKK